MRERAINAWDRVCAERSFHDWDYIRDEVFTAKVRTPSKLERDKSKVIATLRTAMDAVRTDRPEAEERPGEALNGLRAAYRLDPGLTTLANKDAVAAYDAMLKMQFEFRKVEALKQAYHDVTRERNELARVIKEQEAELRTARGQPKTMAA